MIDPYTIDPYTDVPDATRAVADDTPAYAAWLQYDFAGNTVATWILSLVAVIGIYFALAICKRVVVRHLAGSTDRFSTQTGHLLDKILADLRPWCMVAIALYVGSRVLILPSSAAAAFRLIFIVAVSLQLLLTSRVLVDFVIDRAMARTRKAGQEDPSIASASGIIRFLAMLILGALLVLVGLANFGVEITPLVTGLGIGGIAVALAAQSILGDLFGSLTILFDKPFLVGDFIIVGEQMGTVETIGVKTTRIRALSGEQLVFANSDLLGSRIQNFKRMNLRRVEFRIEVDRGTPINVAEQIPAALRDIVTSIENTRLDRAHLKSITLQSLVYETVYFVLSSDYNTYMDIQQRINLNIMKSFAALGVNFAIPMNLQFNREEKRAMTTDAPPQAEAASSPRGPAT